MPLVILIIVDHNSSAPALEFVCQKKNQGDSQRPGFFVKEPRQVDRTQTDRIRLSLE
jgi:hypothetical protein